MFDTALLVSVSHGSLSAVNSCHASIVNPKPILFMFALFDEIDKHPAASIVAMVWVIGMVLILHGMATAHEVDKDDRYF